MSASEITAIQANVPNALGDSFYITQTSSVGGSGTLSQFDDTITLAPGGSTANIAAMPTITTLVTNTTNLTYDGGLNITTIDGDLQVTNGNISLPTGNVTCNTLNYTTLNPPVSGIVTNPAFVYYVATNGRLLSAGATGTINDPFSLIADALTMPAAIGPGIEGPGMTIYLAPGLYTESFTITISATLPSCSIIGMSDTITSSKRARITGTVSIVGTLTTHRNTINTVGLSNLTVSAPAIDTNAVSISGVGIRVNLTNGLYTSQFAGSGFGPSSSVMFVTNSGTTLVNRVQLSMDNCNVTVGSNVVNGGACMWIMNSAQLLTMTNCDLTNRGGRYALYASTGVVTTVFASVFTTAGATAVYLAPTLLDAASGEVAATASVASFTNCFFDSKATITDAIIAINPAVQNGVTFPSTVNISLCTLFNNGTETAGVASTTPYIAINLKGVILIQRSQIITKNSPLSITPYKTNTAATSGLYYFGNTYISAAISVGYIPPAGWGLGIIKLTSEP